ncbi:MAG: hypothetical protein IJS68_04020 [Clostridia bacterium]|nr:hypothetical protein [Clostridia bacterium]
MKGKVSGIGAKAEGKSSAVSVNKNTFSLNKLLSSMQKLEAQKVKEPKKVQKQQPQEKPKATSQNGAFSVSGLIKNLEKNSKPAKKTTKEKPQKEAKKEDAKLDTLNKNVVEEQQNNNSAVQPNAPQQYPVYPPYMPMMPPQYPQQNPNGEADQQQNPYGQYPYPYVPQFFVAMPYNYGYPMNNQMPGADGQNGGFAFGFGQMPQNTNQQTQQEPTKDDDEDSQKKLKTFNYFASRSWTRKQKDSEADKTEDEGKPKKDYSDLDFDDLLDALDEEADEQAEEEENKQDQQTEEEADEDVDDFNNYIDELDSELENKKADEEETEQETLNEAEEPETLESENNETESETEDQGEQSQPEQEQTEEKEEQQPQAISKLDYFKYRFLDNSAAGINGKNRIEQLSTKYGTRRETNVGQFQSEESGFVNDEQNVFNTEDFNLDFSKKGSVKVYKDSKTLSIASIFFALLYAVAGVVLFMMYGSRTVATVVAEGISLNVKSNYVLYVEVGQTLDLSNFEISVEKSDKTVEIVKVENSMISQFPGCINSETLKVVSPTTRAVSLSLSYEGKTTHLKIWAYQFGASDVSIKYQILSGSTILPNLSNVLCYADYAVTLGAKTISKRVVLNLQNEDSTKNYYTDSTASEITSIMIDGVEFTDFEDITPAP